MVQQTREHITIGSSLARHRVHRRLPGRGDPLAESFLISVVITFLFSTRKPQLSCVRQLLPTSLWKARIISTSMARPGFPRDLVPVHLQTSLPTPACVPQALKRGLGDLSWGVRAQDFSPLFPLLDIKLQGLLIFSTHFHPNCV